MKNARLVAARMLAPAARVAIVMLLVAIAAWSGLGAAGDRALRAPYYRLRGDRDSQQHVILVAIDAPTLAAWGPPPWKGVDSMFAAIAAGKPHATGVVDDPARIGAVPAHVISGPVGFDIGPGPVEVVRVGDATEPTATARIASAARIELAPGPINFVGRRGLPTVSAIDVARGAIPPQTFAGKLVVVGLTAQPYAGLVPTPIGPLAPAQIQAHALAASADDAAWAIAPAWLRWFVIAAACAIAFVIARIPSRIATAANVLVAIAFLLLDYVLFATGGALLGATLPVLTVAAMAGVERIAERNVLQRHVREIAHWTRRWMLLETMRDHGPSDKPGYWRRVGELTRMYLGATSSIIAELPAGAHHLELRVFGNAVAAQVKERRLDIRRSPYRKAHLTLGPVWHDSYLAEGRTLIVPLIVRGTQLVGFWMVTFERRSVVTASHMALIKTLAHEIGRALERGRHATAGNQGLSLEIEDVKRAFAAHGQNQQDLLTLGEALPFGVFVSSLWGDVRYANSAMKRLCLQRGIDIASADGDLAGLLGALTARESAVVHAELRELVQSKELYLRGEYGDIALSWLGREDDAERLVVGWVLPGGSQASRPADDHAATLLRKQRARGSRPPTEDAMTVPHQKIAHGTPAFDLEPSCEVVISSAPMAPKATFEIERLAPGETPSVTKTKRMFKFETD